MSYHKPTSQSNKDSLKHKSFQKPVSYNGTMFESSSYSIAFYVAMNWSKMMITWFVVKRRNKYLINVWTLVISCISLMNWENSKGLGNKSIWFQILIRLLQILIPQDLRPHRTSIDKENKTIAWWGNRKQEFLLRNIMPCSETYF